MHESFIPSITELSLATAAYESAWRNRFNDGLDRDGEARADVRMRDAYLRQQASLDHLVALVGGEHARAIHGSMIVATSATNGRRPLDRFQFTSPSKAERFVEQVVAGEAGV